MAGERRRPGNDDGVRFAGPASEAVDEQSLDVRPDALVEQFNDDQKHGGPQ